MGFIATAAVLGIVSWVGYTLAVTPPPKPMEEIEEELRKAERSITDRAEELVGRKVGEGAWLRIG